MNKNLSVYIAVALMLGSTVLVALVQRLTDGDRVNSIAHRIADFELPAGYQTDYTVEMLGYTIAAYKSSDRNGHLAFLQAPPGVIPDEQVIEGYQTNESMTTAWRDATLILTDERTVRDHPASLTISDRTNGEGQRYRSLNLVFQGREGTVLLVINQPVAQWDEAGVEAFIASID